MAHRSKIRKRGGGRDAGQVQKLPRKVLGLPVHFLRKADRQVKILAARERGQFFEGAQKIARSLKSDTSINSVADLREKTHAPEPAGSVRGMAL